MTETLKDKIKKAKEKALAEQKSRGGGDRNYWKPEPGKEIHFRILARPDAPEPWVMKEVHYIEGSDGTKMVGCSGDDECYTCQKLDEMSKSGSKEDKKRVHRSRRQSKIFLQVVDWDNRSKGPQLWEPKNTQSCSQWMNILGLIDNADFGPALYRFKEGRLITMSMTAQQKKIEGSLKQVLSLRSMQAGTKDLPVVVGKTKSGFAIVLVLKDGSKKQFPMADMSELVPDYDETAHKQAWGEEVIEEEVEDVVDEEETDSEASDEDFNDIAGDDEEEEEPAPKKKVKKAKPAKEEEEEEEVEFEEEEEEEPAPKKKAKKKAPVEEEEEELEDTEEEEDFEFSDEDEEEAPKKPAKKGGKK